MIGRSSPARPSRVERQAYKWVMRMLDDPGANAAALERWLSKDPERREVYKRVAIEVGYASDAAAEMPLLRAAAVRHNPKPERKWSGFFIATGLTTALVVVALLGWRIVAGGQQVHGPQVQVATLLTNEGSKAFRLADGSSVTLFGSSKARVRFSAHERAVDLQQGHARFFVTHDASRSFSVYVQGGKVTAVGTVFDVDTRSRVLVQLLKGRVIVTLPQQRDETHARKVALDAGERMMFPSPNEKEPMAKLSDQRTSSVVAIKSYDDVSVADIIEEVNAQSEVKIVLADPAIGREKVFGELNVSDAEAVARKIAIILDLDVERSGPDQLRLTRKH